MGNKLFVGGLAWAAGESTLREAFEAFGTVTDAAVITDRETGRSRGFGFVTFANPEEAAKAVQQMDGAEVAGRRITVREAEERGPRPGGPGGGDRRPPPRRDGPGGPPRSFERRDGPPSRGPGGGGWSDDRRGPGPGGPPRPAGGGGGWGGGSSGPSGGFDGGPPRRERSFSDGPRQDRGGPPRPGGRPGGGGGAGWSAPFEGDGTGGGWQEDRPRRRADAKGPKERRRRDDDFEDGDDW